ncbi:MAG: hypothetical protein IJK26_09680 [Clostridia bacterium]|nr:hypothetical protein [Clostridia bacterium]
MKDVVTSAYRIKSTLRLLCIKHNFFNDGTNAQYERMFELAAELVTKYIQTGGDTDVEERLIDVIWVCTSDEETDESIPVNKIAEAIKPWFAQMKDELG